jgi:hypothetical protein
MIPPGCRRLLQRGERCCREQPWPDTRLGRRRLCSRSGVDQKHSRLVPFQVSWVQVFPRCQRRSECREHRGRKRPRAVFAALAVRHGAAPRLTIHTRHPERPTCRQPQPAAIPPLHHQLIRRRHIRKHRGHLCTRPHPRHVGWSRRPDHPFHRPTCLVQHRSLTP